MNSYGSVVISYPIVETIVYEQIRLLYAHNDIQNSNCLLLKLI